MDGARLGRAGVLLADCVPSFRYIGNRLADLFNDGKHVFPAGFDHPAACPFIEAGQ